MHDPTSPAAHDDPVVRWRDGPPLALPRGADTVARWWGGRSARERAVVVAVLALVLLAALTVGARRGVPGPPRSVLVVQQPAAAGTPAAALLLEADRREQDGVPADALDPGGRHDAIGDARLAVGLVGGEVLRSAHLRDVAPHESLAPGRVAVVVALTGPAPPAPGERVDLFDTAGVPSGSVVAVGAVVLAMDADGTWLDVARDEAVAVTAADASATLAVARLPP